ncbi:hypothetical protein SAMN05216436_10172 [bacterium A37T11]|nr:hypothetical protein SAMN05216436_10172 [bacterium A37T11]
MYICRVNTNKTHKATNRQIQSKGNPFLKLIEDKEKIFKAVQEGKPLGTLKGVRFVKPL